MNSCKTWQNEAKRKRLWNTYHFYKTLETFSPIPVNYCLDFENSVELLDVIIVIVMDRAMILPGNLVSIDSSFQAMYGLFLMNISYLAFHS